MPDSADNIANVEAQMATDGVLPAFFHPLITGSLPFEQTRCDDDPERVHSA